MKKKHLIRIAGIVIFVGIIVVLRYFRVYDYLSLSYITSQKESYSDIILKNYWQAVLLYMLIYIFVVYLMMPITLVLNIAAGYFFGVIPGTIYSVLSACIGALLSLLTFRYLIGDWVREKYSKQLGGFTKNFKEHGVYYLLSLQLFPITPFPIINICAGLSGISLITFVLSTLVGITPGTIIYTFAGRQLAHIKSAGELLSWQNVSILLILSVLSLIPIITKLLKRKWNNR